MKDKSFKLLIIDRKIIKKHKNIGVTKIIEKLKDKIKIDVLWILVNPSLIDDVENLDFNYKDFEDYKTKNMIKILEKEKPDAIIIGNDFDFRIRSFIPAAKKLKIPVILLLQTPFFDYYYRKMNVETAKGRFTVINQKKMELVKNYFYMIKNYLRTQSITSIIKMIFRDCLAIKSPKMEWGRNNCDLILVTGKSWKKDLEDKGVKSKIIITGMVHFDSKIEQIKSLQNQNQKENKKLKIVLLTTPLKEHGLMSTVNWEKIMKDIISSIIPEFEEKCELFIKIHPTSERIHEYRSLINKMGIKIPILQNENLIETLWNADLVIAYGYSGSIIDAVVLKKPILITNFLNLDISNFPHLKEGLATEIKNPIILRNQIERWEFKKNVDADEFIKKYFHKIDGKSTERTVDAIIELINNNN
jgi:hypothetical protein